MLKSTSARVLLVLLTVLLTANIFIRPAHPHFAVEALPGFWAAFGLAVGLGLAAFAGKLLAPALRQKEDGHDS